jgi:hypothetical protein
MIAEALALAIVTATPAGASLSHDQAARYSADIAAVAEDVEEAIALSIVANYESDWRASVASCEVTGDDGRAVSIYQLHAHHLHGHSREDVCKDNRLATRLAAQVLGQLHRAIGTWRDTFARYVGTWRRYDPRVVKRDALFQRLTTKFQ